MGLTTDPDDPRLTRGVDAEPTDQAEMYLVLSEEERTKGFVRPYRDVYRHVGPLGPQYPLRDLTEEEQERYAKFDYLKFEQYPEGSSVLGRYWTLDQLSGVGKGCGVETRMGRALSETYQADPSFYGATYCVGCRKHLPVGEFIWTADGERVGS